MGRSVLSVLMLALACAALPAAGELQNVELGGSLSITGWYYNYDSIPTTAYIDQFTRLSVRGDFTDNVTAFVEAASYDAWGEDFRSGFLGGGDFRADSTDDVEIYQAYVEARELWGAPLTLRAGRQELAFGSEWLVGDNSDSSPVFGLSFDALRLTLAQDTFSLDLVAAKLAEGMSGFGGDDTDFYMVYFSHTGVEDHVFDAYWMFVRDDAATAAFETDLHTLGLRAAGAFGALDYEVEAAWQTGGVEGLFSACPAGFGTADTDYGAPAAAATVGYTLECPWTPRIFASFAYLGGGDPDRSPFSNDRTLPFNRLFSDVEYTEFLAFTDMTNILFYGVGVEAAPTETVALSLLVSHLEADEAMLGPGGWLTRDEIPTNLGWEAALSAEYQYSDDLGFYFTYAHFFGADGLGGSYVIYNGLFPWQGDGDDDYDVVYLGSTISF